ncbi:gas vesicle accessory protein GvpU [Ralstonia pseudosolanacearum]
MTVDQEKNTGNLDELRGLPGPLPIDWQLQNLVDLANRQGLRVGLTLTVKGATITGMLIGGKEYFEMFGDSIGSSWPGTDEVKEAMRSAFAQPANLYETEEQSSPSYIHLKDAKIVYSSAMVPTNRGLLWRGRLDEVSGFAIGSLSVD